MGEPLGEYMDCEMLWPTTTTTTEEPGCCKGSSYKAQAKCLPLMDEMGCARKGCEWIVTDEPDDCIITTTTTTTTAEPGCCKGDSARTNERCNKMEGREKCERSSSCHFISGGVVEKDCVVDETTTSEPGCCYGNPDAAYSKRWMESCTAFYTERDCLLLTNGDGEARCAWEALGDGYDCAQLWPTTTSTTTEPGCCYGDTAASNEMCATFDDDADKCDARGQCVFRSGESADCTFVPTTTTEEIGCCAGTTRKNAEMCAEKDGREQCERSGKCSFVVTDDYADCDFPTTTSEPWLNAKHSAKGKKRAKGANAQQSMLFGGEASSVAEAMQYQVSLSTVLAFVVAAFALNWAYQCFVANRNDGFKNIDAVRATSTYQAV